MIKIQFTGNMPGMYQVDRSHNLPGVTGAVQWNGTTKRFEVSCGGSWMAIDNTVEMNSSGPDVWEMYNWIQQKKREEQEMQALRSKYPSLDEAYKHLDFIKALVKTGPEETVEEPNRP